MEVRDRALEARKMIDLSNPEPGIYRHVPFDEYHKIRAISRSGLKDFRSAKENFLYRPERAFNANMAFGSQYHAFILEPELFDSAYVEYDGRRDMRTQKYAELVADIGSEDRIYKPADKAQMEAMAKQFHEYPVSYKWVTGIDPRTGERDKRRIDHELTVVAKCEITGLMLKCRLDALWVDLGTIVDLKTSKCAEPGAFKYDCKKYGYDLQPGFYTYCCSLIPDLAHVVNFYFVVQQKEEPYMVRQFPVREYDIDTDKEVNPVPRLQGEVKNLLIDLKNWLDAGKPLPDEPNFITFLKGDNNG